MKTDYDIIIVGAGIVGTSLALALAHLPLQIAVLEKIPFNSTDSIPEPQGKPIALHYASSCILQTLIPWLDLAAYGNPINAVHISEAACFATGRITAQEIGVSALGYVISATQLAWICIKALLHVAKSNVKKSTLTLFNPAYCQALVRTKQVWETHVVTSQTESLTITAPLLIAADGSHSLVRHLLGIGIQQKSTDQLALVTSLHLARHHRHIAYQRFIDEGIVACLPLLGNRVGFIWTAVQAVIDPLQSLTESDFLDRVQSLFGYRLGKFLASDPLHVYPIKSFIAERQAQSGLILLGNAAHTLSPIAAQGLNLALHDMAELANILTHAFHKQTSFADPEISQAYLAARSRAQKQVMGFTKNLSCLFNQTFGPLTLLRNSGLLAFDCFSPLKRTISRRLMGIHGRLPPLVRGFIH